jgi:hypothetical protein
LLLDLLPGSHVPPLSSSPTCYKGSSSPIIVQAFSSVTAQALQHNGMGKMGPESRLLPPSCQSASYGCVVPPGSESRQLHNPSLVNTAERKSQLHFSSTDDNPGPVNMTRTRYNSRTLSKVVTFLLNSCQSPDLYFTMLYII